QIFILTFRLQIRRTASGEDIGMADKGMDVEAPALSEEPQEAARDETLAKMELGKKDVGPKPAETELGKKLKTFALKPEKWVPHFQQLLGVENTEALQYLGTEDYLKLEKYTEHSWEKQALQKLLNIEDPQITQKKLLDEQVEQKKEIQDKAKRELKEKQDKAKQELSENQDKAKKALEDIKKSNKEAKTLTANTAKSTTESFQMHKDKSVKSSKPLEEMIEKSHKELTVTGGSPSNATNLSDADVLYQASGGLALEGIYMTKRQEDVLMKRERLLDVPSGIALAGPLQQPVLKQKEFSSSDEESMFQHSMEKLGFSITTAAKGGFWGFQAEASFGYSSTNMSEKKREFHTEHAYISTTKYSYIPLASCYIPKEKLHLSTAALEELKSIEQLLDYCDKVEKASAKERYKKFFSCFGSHANQGPLHFGGIYWWTASSRGFKQEMLEKVKEETTRAVNASVNVSYSGLLSASAGIDVAKTDTKQSSSKHETKKLEKNIELSVTKTGGPPTVDSPNDWKSGLQANNRTWSVIDRGTHLIPVWDIILSSHKEDFKDVYQVAKDLKNIYASATGLHHNLPIGENVSTAVNEANSFFSQLLSWEVHPTQQQLKRLIDFRQYLNEKTGNYNVWLNVCLPREELRGFLGRVQEFYSQSSREDESVIRCMLKCLLQNIACSSVNEDSYAPLINWIYQSKKEQHLLDVSDFSALIELMSQAKEDLQVNSTDDGDEEIQEATTKLSVIINSYLQSFLKTLRRMEQKEEELLVVCAASCVGYSLQNHYFQQGLGWQEVTFLVEKMQYLINEYRNLKDIKAYRGQAFILAEGLTLGDEDSRHRSTTEKKEFLQFMLEKIGSTLEPEIMTVLQKHSEPFDLQSLIADLNHLRLGTSEAIGNDTTESLVNTLKTLIVSTTESQDQPTITTVETTTDNQNVHSFMEMLGLGQYYPKGLNRRNFHVVHKSLQIHPEKENELPRQFMQMLMGLDYRFRYLVCKNTDVSNAKNIKNPEDDISMFDTVDDLLDFCSKEETHVVQTETKEIHPMDLLLAIFHCADDMMRQYIFTKMSMCQFALPLIVPRPYDSMIEIPLWAFRQVYKSILDTDASDIVKHKEKTICQSDFPVVCFTRFGTAPFSKSQILNNLLSKHKHDVFFHRNCEGSVKNRILVDGLAEIFWFCPSGKDTDQFKKFTAFVNLHGDALTYAKQSSVLQEISSVNVILFSRSDKKEQGSELLRKLKEKPLIILSPDKESSMNVYTESKQVIIGLKNQNEAKVLKELTDSLCHKDKEILIQWKANTENRLKCLYTELVEETTRQAMEHINLKKSQTKVKQRQTGYEEELFTKSKQLALDIKDEGLDESQLSDHFNILWQEWVAEINATTPHTEKPNIIAEAEDVLLGYFRHERSMNYKLKTFSRWTSFSIDLPNHAVGKKSFLRCHKLDDSDKTQIMMVFNNLVVDICDYLEKKRKERVDYNQVYFHEIINKVSESVSSINSDASRKFTVTDLFKFDVSLHLLGLAVPKFESMHEAFQRANNPVVTLENNREEFFNCFKISCQGAASIKTFSDFLCAKIVEAMRSALYDRTTLAIVDEMTCNFPTFSGNRSKLENDILLDLVEQEDFEKYREYIHFPKEYFKSFIEKCVHNYCLGKNPQRMKNFLQISLDYFRKKILESIIESTKFKNKSSDMSNWLDVFYERIEDLVSFSRADLKSIEHQEIQDIQFFQEVMCTAWDTAIENFQKGLATINFDSFEKKPHEILIEQLCGCWEQCPFCKAICTNTIPGHDGDHSVAFHRSQAINGMPWVDSNEFVTEICSSLVSSDSCLVVDSLTQIPYKHYRKIGPNYANWSITPDTSSQLYWKWYVCKFRTNLQDDYGLKFENRGEIPCQWESIKKEDVIASLRDL
ncbi:hypothetical protein AB205_0168360, partial [Aquarana catesbeiana]